MITINPPIKKLFEESIVALATCNKNGKPNCVCVNHCKVVSPNQILITDKAMNKTKINLLENGQVALTFWDQDGSCAYQFKGNAQYIASGPWKKKVDQDPNNKNSEHKAAILVSIAEIWDLTNSKLLLKDNY
jgi:predicted pyridoxine 5'-phosphate oxidase superfamily flavin-nucleotide-binding protein